MTHTDLKQKIADEHNRESNKLTYYIIALCVAAIGFSVTQTMGAPLSLSQIPLALAVICWGLSIFYGIRYLEISLRILYRKAKTIDYGTGKETITLDDGTQVPPKLVVEEMEKLQKKQAFDTGIQFRLKRNLFYIGIAFFLGWRVWEMYLLTL